MKMEMKMMESMNGDGAAGDGVGGGGDMKKKKSSFKMDRGSPLALSLKASVSVKLTQFIDNFPDDILAEYIVVLVCNGKNQSQAKDELDAFLGERSGEFVSWLWEFLSKAVRRVSGDSSNPKGSIVRSSAFDGDADNEKGICRLRVSENCIIDNADNHIQSKGEISHLSTSVPSRTMKVHDPCLHCKPEPNSCSDVEDTQRVLKKICTSEVHRQSGSAEVKHSATLKDASSRVKGSSRILAGGEQHLQYVDHRKKQLDIIEKIVISNSNELPRQPLQSPNRKLHTGKSPSVMAENPQPRPLPVTNFEGSTRLSVESASQQNMRPRGNVWDRLGAPCEDNKVVSSRKLEVALVERRAVAHDIDRLDQPRLMVSGAGGIYTRRSLREVATVHNNSSVVIPDTNNDEYQQKHSRNTMWSPHDGNNFNRKRQFGEIDNGPPSLVYSNRKQFQVKETSEEFKKLSSPECNCFQRLDNAAAETRKLDATSKSSASRSPNIALNGRDNKVLHSQLTRMATEDVLNVKLRLQQMELEVLKLRSKQMEVSSDSKVGSFSSSGPSGALSLSEEDNESRTVFVTNVHFAASKGALTMHFSKCGVITNILMLSDVTGKPKGSAYVTFASEKAMDKALLLNGSPFWSRTLKVVRKAEMSAATVLEPSQLAGKPSQTWFPLSKAKFAPLKPYGSSHLQWRRDQQANAGNTSISTSGDGVNDFEGEKQNVDSVDHQIPPTEANDGNTSISISGERVDDSEGAKQNGVSPAETNVGNSVSTLGDSVYSEAEKQNGVDSVDHQIPPAGSLAHDGMTTETAARSRRY